MSTFPESIPMATSEASITLHQDGANGHSRIEEEVGIFPVVAAAEEETKSAKRKRDNEEEKQGVTEEKESINGDSEKHPLWKTSLCSYFRSQSKSCSHADSCRYAHGEEELRPRPDKTWDPTSERARKENESSLPNENPPLQTSLCVDPFTDTSGIAKCVLHLPMKWASEEFRAFLDSEGVLYQSAKKKKGMTVGFVQFSELEHLLQAEKLQGKSVSNRNLLIADVVHRLSRGVHSEVLSERKDMTHESSEESALLSDKQDDSNTDELPSKTRNARDVVTPLSHMTYEAQLEFKMNSLTQTLKRLTRNARKACPSSAEIPKWIAESRSTGGLPCKLEGIIESPQVNGYRNKSEFSVGYSPKGDLTVGFMLGNFREGITTVEEPVDCPNTSEIACRYASIFKDFLRSSSLPVWNRVQNTGFWRQLTVREGRIRSKSTASTVTGDALVAEVMLIVQVSTDHVDEEIRKHEFQKLAHAISLGASANSPPLPLTSIVLQDHNGISNAAPVDCPLFMLSTPKAGSGLDLEEFNSEGNIHDDINGLQFSISPTAFFQVNTLAAEKLYSLAGEWAGLGPDTLLFDVCCGTGTIGLTLAHRVGMVVGIEMNPAAVADAQRNSNLNGISNCRFVCAKAEDVMGSLLKEYLSIPQKENEVDVPQPEDSHVVREEVAVPCKSGAECETPNGAAESTCKQGDASNGVDADTELTDVVTLVESNGHSGDHSQKAKAVSNKKEVEPVKKFKHVVAIVDPPRVGLHPSVLKALRTHEALRRIVYISCNPESLVANAIELCTPIAGSCEKVKQRGRWQKMSNAGLARHRVKSMPMSEPFSPVKAVAVDLFPHTPHCELVMLLER